VSKYTFLSVLYASDGSLCWQQPLRIGSEESYQAMETSLDNGVSKPSTPLGGDPTVPCIADNIIYVAVGGTLLAFHLHDGQLLWRYYTEGTFLSPPKTMNGIVCVGANDGYVYALQGDNGVLLWRTQIEMDLNS